MVALTTSAFDHDREEILAAGFDDVILKPFREETILGVLAEQLRARFLYETAEVHASEHDGSDTRSDRDRMRAIPPALASTLGQAVEIGDVEAALAAIDRIAETDAALADTLRRMVKDYSFDAIATLVEGR